MDGLKYVPYRVSCDSRGKSSCLFEKGEGEDFEISEVFVSQSEKNVIRGMHFQPYPYGQKKQVTVLNGQIRGSVVDLRKDSPTYLRNVCVELDENSGKSILIPEYCAWGFAALGDKNIVLYQIAGEYQKEYDCGIRWDSFGYEWNIDTPIIGERDKALQTLDEYLKNEAK